MRQPAVPLRRIQEDLIVTGEAVNLDIRPASPMYRIAAFLIDAGVTILCLLCIVIALAEFLPPGSRSMERVYGIGLLVVTFILVPLTIEVLTKGRSLGKWAFDLQVVRDDGGVVTLRHSLVRVTVGIIELWLSGGGIALLTTMLTQRSKRLGDIAAGTMVVRLPSTVWTPPLIMPPELTEWAMNAQVLEPPAELHNEALRFLRNNRETPYPLRQQVSTELASKLGAYVAPKPPAHVNPERVVAAVLVVLRDREYRRLHQRQLRMEERRQQVSAAPFGV